MRLPSVSEIEREIREHRDSLVRLRRSDGALGGEAGATCTMCLFVLGDEVFVGDVEAEASQTHTAYGSEVVPRLGVKFDVKAAARRLREAAEKGASCGVAQDSAPASGVTRRS